MQVIALGDKVADTIEKTQSDVGEVQVKVSAAERKVELDIDDAPFLMDDEEEEVKKEEDAQVPAEAPPTEEVDPSSAKRKKLIIIGGILAVILLIVAIAVWWFFIRTPPPPPSTLEPEIIRVPSDPGVAVPDEILVSFEPYWMPFEDKNGRIVFLYFKFSILTKDDMLAKETENKTLVLRDAVYYYLENKSYEFLLDPVNVDLVKKDITSVLSGYLAGGNIEDVLFESYLGDK